MHVHARHFKIWLHPRFPDSKLPGKDSCLCEGMTCDGQTWEALLAVRVASTAQLYNWTNYAPYMCNADNIIMLRFPYMLTCSHTNAWEYPMRETIVTLACMSHACMPATYATLG
jgi:hypothetical protein